MKKPLSSGPKSKGRTIAKLKDVTASVTLLLIRLLWPGTASRARSVIRRIASRQVSAAELSRTRNTPESCLLLLTCQCDQHWIGKLFNTDMAHHVDHLGGCVLGVRANMDQDVTSLRWQTLA